MNLFLKYAPVLIATFVLSVFMSVSLTPARSSIGMDLEGFASTPVVNGGRVKPLDTVARTALLVISNKTVYPDAEGRPQPAIRWLLDVMLIGADKKTPGWQHKVFRIENDQLLSMLGLEPRPGSYRYSLAEIEEHRPELIAQTTAAKGIPAEKRELFQSEALKLMDHLELVYKLANLNEPLLIPSAHGENDWLTLPEAYAHKPRDPAADQMLAIIDAYKKDDAAGFNRALTTYQATLEARVPTVTVDKASYEKTFNRAELCYWCMFFYFTVFLLSVAGWVLSSETRASNFCFQMGFWLTVAAVIVHTFALWSRMAIQNRYAPVTNLYSSAVFIGWGCVWLGLIVEKVMGLGIGNALAAVVGGFTLIVAYFLALEEGDTMEMMRAVLDTTFWLATHVVCVTTGYTATFAAGTLGTFYILWGLFTTQMTRPLARRLWEVMYAVVCFAMLLSFVGTVLGGIWADQSWGRFWGWDPKENGAVLIVIWNALVLHARWGGMVKERGMAVLTVFGSIVTIWSYFGTNQLGVGLHAYGFSKQLAVGLVIFWGVHLGIIALGLIPLKYWRSFRVAALPAPDDDLNPLRQAAAPAPHDGIQPPPRPGRRPRLA